jgi:hypothetical protein
VIAGEINAESVALSGHVSDQTVIRASSLQVTLGQNGTGGKLHVTFGRCEVEAGEPAALADKRFLQEHGKKQES